MNNPEGAQDPVEVAWGIWSARPRRSLGEKGYFRVAIEAAVRAAAPSQTPVAEAGAEQPQYPSRRERLPNRREVDQIKFDVQRRDGPRLPYHATVGYYPDGRVGELFLAAGKIGSDAEVLMRDSAIALSFALQHGATVDELRAAMCRDEQGQPEGPLGTILDLLAR